MAKEPMQLAVEHPRPDVVVVKLSGDLGISSMIGANAQHTGVDGDTALAAALRSAVPNPPRRVIIDLGDATSISSLGIGALVRFKQLLQKSDCDLSLAGTSDLVTLLRRCKLHQVFTLYPDVAAALRG